MRSTLVLGLVGLLLAPRTPLPAQSPTLHGCDPFGYVGATIACGLEAAGIPAITDHWLNPSQRELRFIYPTSYAVPIYVGIIRARNDTVDGQGLLIWKEQFAENEFARRTCGKRWVGRGVVTCEASHSASIDWEGLLRTLDSAGVTTIPSDPAVPIPCSNPEFIEQDSASVLPIQRCVITNMGGGGFLEYRDGLLQWSYGFRSHSVDTTTTAYIRDRAIVAAWGCAISQMLGSGCRPAMHAHMPFYQWLQRPRGRDWRPTTGLLTFGTDSLIRTRLPDGYREYRIQLDCTGCTPGVVIRILRDPAGPIHGAAWLMTATAPDIATAYREWVERTRERLDCGPAASLDWPGSEGCEIGLDIDWSGMLQRIEASGVLTALSDTGRIVDPPFHTSARRAVVNPDSRGAPRLMVDPGPGRCPLEGNKELIIERIDGEQYGAASFWCLQDRGEPGTAHRRHSDLRTWLANAFDVETQ